MLVDEGASLEWLVQSKDQGRPPGPLLDIVFPPYQVSEALTMRALHLIVVISYHIFFLQRCGWSRSFHLTMHGKLVGTFPRAVSPIPQGGNFVFLG